MYREKDNNCFKSKCNTNKKLQIDCNFMFYIIYHFPIFNLKF